MHRFDGSIEPKLLLFLKIVNTTNSQMFWPLGLPQLNWQWGVEPYNYINTTQVITACDVCVCAWVVKKRWGWEQGIDIHCYIYLRMWVKNKVWVPIAELWGSLLLGMLSMHGLLSFPDIKWNMIQRCSKKNNIISLKITLSVCNHF